MLCEGRREENMGVEGVQGERPSAKDGAGEGKVMPSQYRLPFCSLSQHGSGKFQCVL